MIYNVSAIDVIIFDENYRTDIRTEAANDTLNFSESVVSSIKPLYLTDQLQTHEILLVNGDFNLSLMDTLDFIESVCPRAFIVNIDDFLFITDELTNPKHGGIYDTITFNESFPLAETSKPVIDLIDFIETLGLLKIVQHPLTESLTLNDHATCIRLGEGDHPGQILFQTLSTYITLTDDQARELRLPYPKFGDTENFHFKRINRQTRDLSPIITAIPAWNRTQLFKMEFEVFDVQIIENLKVFLRNNLGKPVTLVDHNSVVRNVIIQNPDREISTLGRDYFNFTLDCYELI